MDQLRDISNLNKINHFNTSSTSISKRLTKMEQKQAKSSLKQLLMQVCLELENWSPVHSERTRSRSDLRTLQISWAQIIIQTTPLILNKLLTLSGDNTMEMLLTMLTSRKWPLPATWRFLRCLRERSNGRLLMMTNLLLQHYPEVLTGRISFLKLKESESSILSTLQEILNKLYSCSEQRKCKHSKSNFKINH